MQGQFAELGVVQTVARSILHAGEGYVEARELQSFSVHWPHHGFVWTLQYFTFQPRAFSTSQTLPLAETVQFQVQLSNCNVFIYFHCIGFNELLESGYTYLLPPEVPTNISRQNLKGNQSYDNIWVSSEVHKRKFSGVYGVIREGLQIQTEASTVGSTGSTVSDHCPVWAEFQCT